MNAPTRLGLELTNTLAYYVTTLITDVKRFIVLLSLLGTYNCKQFWHWQKLWTKFS
jgi:hypothetical protein